MQSDACQNSASNIPHSYWETSLLFIHPAAQFFPGFLSPCFSSSCFLFLFFFFFLQVLIFCLSVQRFKLRSRGISRTGDGVVTEAAFICAPFASRSFLRNNKNCHSNREKKRKRRRKVPKKIVKKREVSTEIQRSGPRRFPLAWITDRGFVTDFSANRWNFFPFETKSTSSFFPQKGLNPFSSPPIQQMILHHSAYTSAQKTAKKNCLKKSLSEEIWVNSLKLETSLDCERK